MDAVGSALGNGSPSNRTLNNFARWTRFQSVCVAQHKKLEFGKICSYGNITLRKHGLALKVFQCADRVPDVSNYSEKLCAGSPSKKNLAVFVSGGGSNFRSIHNASANGLIHGDVVVLVTDKLGCGGADYARDHDIPVIQFPKLRDSLEGLSPTDLVISLRKLKVHYILLAGFLKLIPIELIQAYPRSILNIHPSLLPAFGGKGYYGLKVHKAVIASGARYSGPTVHFVDEHYDTGRILAQKVVPVLANDTAEQLASRVLREEHRLYAEVVSALCDERVVWREDGVPLIRSRDNPDEYL